MGDLHGVRVEGQQPGADEDVDHGGGLLRVRQMLQQALVRHPAARLARDLTDLDQPQQHLPRRAPLRRVQPGVHPLRGGGDGAVQATGQAVPGDGEGAAGALLPGGEQGVRQQRQRAAGHRLVVPVDAQVGQQQLFEARLQLQRGLPRGAGDRRADFAYGHRTQREDPGGQGRGERGVVQARAVEVGADSDDHGARGVPGGRAQRRDEGAPLAGVLAGGEDLLELVDDEDQARTGAERGADGGGAALGGLGQFFGGGGARVPGPASAAASSVSGCAPGVRTRTGQCREPGSAPARRAGSSPARSSEDFPAPDGAARTSGPALSMRSARRPTRAAVARSRPKNQGASAAV